MSTLIEQFEDYKKTDEYETYRDSLLKDFPELFRSQIEMSIFTWFNENKYKEYCEENLIEWKSLLDEVQNITITKPPTGTVKAVKSYSKEEWEKEYSSLEPIKGTVNLIKEEDTTFKLPNLSEE